MFPRCGHRRAPHGGIAGHALLGKHFSGAWGCTIMYDKITYE